MAKKKSWIVMVKASVTKELICDNCTEEEAKTDPFRYASNEQEISQYDWEVESVEENV